MTKSPSIRHYFESNQLQLTSPCVNIISLSTLILKNRTVGMAEWLMVRRVENTSFGFGKNQNNADNAEYLTDGPGVVLQISALSLWSLQQAGRWLRVWGGRGVSHQRADAYQDSSTSDSPACIIMYPHTSTTSNKTSDIHITLSYFIQLLGCHCFDPRNPFFFGGSARFREFPQRCGNVLRLQNCTAR